MALTHLACPSCKGPHFEVRALKEEGLATVHCIACQRNYLLLDSEDYWFDTIQGGYPKLKRCRCKSSSFTVRCNYEYREDGDVRSIEVSTTCSVCGKTTDLLELDIDYGDTGELVTNPLRYCKNPKILYNLQSLTLYAARKDITEVIEFLYSDHRCHFHAWLRQDKRWVRRHLNAAEAKDAVLRGRKYAEPEYYFWIYASLRKVEIPDIELDLKAEDIFWKRNELIQISSPTHIGIGQEETLLFYIKFSNEYVDNEAIARKSDAFASLTASLMDWLTSHLVSWRGPRCFDNPDEHVRIFGDQFTKS